ncbi:hypothetical protein ABAC460_15675 [Asticcacaulis sp. AC460]|nr:hypothetical protein ABAC460_15675 [Asticcacaulis sp. AC460]
MVLTAAPYVALAEDISVREEVCGPVKPVSAYTARAAGMKIELPAIRHVKVDGKTVARNEPSPWEDSANGAAMAVTDNAVVILVSETDCIDLTRSDVYVLDLDGKLRASSRLWTENHVDGFVREAGGLVFWSDWFCDSENKDLKPGKSHVYVLKDGARSFVREERSFNAVCNVLRNQRPLRFTPMTAIP